MAPEIVTSFRSIIFDPAGGGRGAKTVDGGAYPKYSTNDKAKGTGKRQWSKFKDSRAPVFTGDLLRDFRFRSVDDSGFTFGTVAWGGKVKSLNKMGREISTDSQPMPEATIKLFESLVDEAMDKELQKKIGKPKVKKYKINVPRG